MVVLSGLRVLILAVTVLLPSPTLSASFLPKKNHRVSFYTTSKKDTSTSSIDIHSTTTSTSTTTRSILAFQHNSNLNPFKNYTNNNNKSSTSRGMAQSREPQIGQSRDPNFNNNNNHNNNNNYPYPNNSAYGNQHSYMNNNNNNSQQQPTFNPQQPQQPQPRQQQPHYAYQPQTQQQQQQQQQAPPQPPQQQQQPQPKQYPPASDRYTPPFVHTTSNYYQTAPAQQQPQQTPPNQQSINGSNTNNNNNSYNYNTYNTGQQQQQQVAGLQKIQRPTSTSYQTNLKRKNINNLNNNTPRPKMNHNHNRDAAAYNQYISKTVDIESVTERNGVLTVIRSCRDIDNNTKRKFISYYNLISLATAGTGAGTAGTSSLSTPNGAGGTSSSSSSSNSLLPGAVVNSSGMTKLVQSLEEQQEDNLSSTMSTTTLSSGEKVMTMMMPPVEIPTKVKARIISPSGNKIALFIQEEEASGDKKNKSEKKQIVEIWTAGGVTLVKRIILPYNKLHGDICFDTSWFGSISWNHDETALVYAAEMKMPLTKSYFHMDDGKSASNPTASATTGARTTSTSTSSSPTAAATSKSYVGATNELGYGKGEDWGEKYTTTCRLNLYVLNIMTNKVGAINNVPGGKKKNDIHASTNPSGSTEGGYTLGQPVFSPCGNYVVYTGWDAGGGGDLSRRLGSIYCYQRPSKIYASSVRQLLVELATPTSAFEVNGDYANFIDAEVVEDDYQCITPNDRLARSPRFCKSSFAGMKKLVYLCNTEGFDTHGGAMALHSVDWNNAQGVQLQTTVELVKVVQLPTFTRDEMDGEKTVLGMSFPGLFMNQLPENCFSQNGKFVLATTQWGSITKIIRINVETGEVKAIDFNLTNQYTVLNDASQRLLCLTSSGDAVVSQSSPSKPTLIGIIPSSYLTDNDVKVKPTLQLPPLPSVTATSKFTCDQIESSGDMACHLVSITPAHGDVKSVVQGILLLPLNEIGEEEKKVPLIVVPHGGPHSCTQATYNPAYAYLCEYGKYAVLHVNYRGSIGFGQLPIQDLAGNVGSQDIDDVVQLTERVLYSFTAIDPSRVGICGGSHGGFLAGHAIGQYPDLFKVAAMRNPVTNIATMVSSTDIPDWCYVEALGVGKYDWETFRGPTPPEMTKMWESSPIAHINSVTAPTLVALGKADKRVPPSQGMEYYHALRSMGVTTKLLTYDDDDHAIDKVQSEADHWINIKQWFDEHI